MGKHGTAPESRITARFNSIIRRIVLRPALGKRGVAYSRGTC